MFVVRALLLAGFLNSGPAPAATAPPRGYKNGVVAADHPLASAAGVEVLRGGGNAVDAACAVAFALGVVNPAGSGLGGGGFMMVRLADKAPVVLDFRETAPAAATRDMYLKPGLPPRPSRVGGLAVGVPGEVAGCALAVKRWGKLPLARVLAPAVRLASAGFAVGPHLALTTQRKRREIARHAPLARIFLPGGEPLRVGQRLRRPLLARSLKAVAAQGPAVFYKGWIAAEIVAAVRASGGLLSAADLAGYRPRERRPLRATYRGHVAYLMPPPSSGGVAITMALNILERLPVGAMGHNSSGYLHHLTEAIKHAFADRARHLGDPDFVKVPTARLTSRPYADTLRARISARVRPIKSYGSPTPARAPTNEKGGTSHVSVVDGAGNAVALTTTINTSFGSMVVAGRAGVVLNNEMDDFAAAPGKPNAFGLVQGEGNAVAPGKRPLSSMSPTIVLGPGGRLRLVAGASGGPTIITGTLQAVINVVDFHLDARAAVSRGRVHHQWLPQRLVVEADLPRDVVFALARRGHRPWLQRHPFTAVQVVVVGSDGILYGASDPRKMGAPAGY